MPSPRSACLRARRRWVARRSRSTTPVCGWPTAPSRAATSPWTKASATWLRSPAARRPTRSTPPAPRRPRSWATTPGATSMSAPEPTWSCSPRTCTSCPPTWPESWSTTHVGAGRHASAAEPTGMPMTDTPWQGDACSLVDAFRGGERSPVEELEATLAAIEASDLNAFTFVDTDQARETAKAADVSLPFGGVPTAIKELDPVADWPLTEASLAFKDRKAPHTSTFAQRLFDRGGVTPVGQTTASEFGGL